MSEQKFPRRTLLKGALLGVAAVPVSALLSSTADANTGRVSPSETQAKSLAYIEDATKVDAKAHPNFKPGQICGNCSHAKPGTGAEVPCAIFANRPGATKGWCKVWMKRP